MKRGKIDIRGRKEGVPWDRLKDLMLFSRSLGTNGGGMMEFQLDVSGSVQRIERYWELLVGSCHAATALREDYRRQLEICRRELGFRYVRFHGILDDDMSVLTLPRLGGPPKISFTNIDNIFDFLLSIGMKPFIELGFMPECLARGDCTVFHYKGHTSPPADYAPWDSLIASLARHLIGRYGRDEVRQWFFEVWNEPNLGSYSGEKELGFWQGTMEEYYELYCHSARAIKSVDPFLKTGGPATSNNAHIGDFIAYCQQRRVPVDFISTHHYPTDIILGYGVENSPNFLRRYLELPPDEAEERQNLIQEYLVFQQHLWEKVDRGVLTDMAKQAAREAGDLPLYYTEWSSLAGLPSDGPFGASFIAKTVMDNLGLVKGYGYWTFSDLFEESGMPSAAFHGGFGLMTLQGIKKAPYRVYQLLHLLGDEKYPVSLSEGTVDLYAFRKEESRALQLLLVNHQSLLHPIQDEEIRISLSALGGDSEVRGEGKLPLEIYRVDEDHANALAKWRDLGSPEYVHEGELDALRGASALIRETGAVTVRDGRGIIDIRIPAMGTALITVYL
jgi:xylan 1,4-beta-xylosidase